MLCQSTASGSDFDDRLSGFDLKLGNNSFDKILIG